MVENDTDILNNTLDDTSGTAEEVQRSNKSMKNRQNTDLRTAQYIKSIVNNTINDPLIGKSHC